MSDLISRKALEEAIVNKVVERLESFEVINNEKELSKFQKGYACTTDISIDIVKAGGINEIN